MLVAVSGLSFGSYAACGGGGYTPRVTTRSSEGDSKVADARRDLEKAQRKYNSCVGGCEKEKQKVEEAERKLAKRSAEVAGR